MNATRTPSERFWTKVSKTETCWLWTAASTNGYGAFNAGDGRVVRAHRWAYEHMRGPIPDGLQLDHLCRVRNCVNPDHLEAVTSAENTRRGEGISAIRARATHCNRGHLFGAVKNGYRLCLQCRSDNPSMSKAARRETQRKYLANPAKRERRRQLQRDRRAEASARAPAASSALSDPSPGTRTYPAPGFGSQSRGGVA